MRVGISDYEAGAGEDGRTIRIADLRADLSGVEFSGDFGSAVADSATGTATISYDELLRTAKAEPTQVAPGITAEVVALSDGGTGRSRSRWRPPCSARSCPSRCPCSVR